jgi:hypothetical protein
VKIRDLFNKGKPSVEVYDEVFDEAIKYVNSEKQLNRCISSIKGKVIFENTREKIPVNKALSIPEWKKFTVAKYNKIIGQ